MEEKQFVLSGVDAINTLKRDTALFTELCTKAQEFARMYYDWSAVIDNWITLLTK